MSCKRFRSWSITKIANCICSLHSHYVTMIKANIQLIEGVSFLKQLREALDLSREQFAMKIGTTASSVYRWETGKATISFTSLQWKNFHREVLEPLEINVYDLPDDLAAPYIPKAG